MNLILERDPMDPGAPSNGTRGYLHYGYSAENVTPVLSLSASVIYYVPYFLANPVACDSFAIQVSSGTWTNLRFGLYAATSALQPVGAPLFDSGDVAGSVSGLKTYAPAAPVYLQRGRYLAAIVSEGSVSLLLNAAQGCGGHSPVIASAAALSSTLAGNFNVSQTYGALPTPGPAWTGLNQNTYGWLAFLMMRPI